MSVLDRVDPGLRALAASYPPMRLATETLAAVRAVAGAEVESTPRPKLRAASAVDGSTIPLRLHGLSRGGAPRAALLHLHGGGYVMGSAAMMDRQNARRARALGCVVMSVDYRLAPEHPYPTPLKDCRAALDWLIANADELGVDSSRIAVIGESAGAGLAAALALHLRHTGGPRLIHQHLLYPMLDDRTAAREAPPALGNFVWNNGHNHFGWSALLGGAPGGEGVSHHAAPGRAADLTGLPPAYVAVGSLDLFLGECLDYARRLAEAGVAVEAQLYPGLFHGAEVFMPRAALSRRFAQDSRRALRRALSLQEPS